MSKNNPAQITSRARRVFNRVRLLAAASLTLAVLGIYPILTLAAPDYLKTIFDTGKNAASKFQAGETLFGGGTGLLEICKSASGAGLDGKIFGFTVSGVPGTFQVPTGFCSGPIQVPAGPQMITELNNGQTFSGETFTGGFLLAGVDKLTPSSNSTLGTVNLSARTAMVNIAEGDIEQQLIVRFTNKYAVNAFVGICNKAPGANTSPANSSRYTIAGFPGEFVAAPGACTLPIPVLLPSSPGAPPVTGIARVTQLSKPGFTLETAATVPIDRFNSLTLGTGINNTSADCLNATDPLTVPGCTFSNPAGGFVEVDIVQADSTPNTTVVNFNNSFEPNRLLKICKIAAAGVPVGMPFTFDISVEGEPETVVNPLTVPAGGAANGGNCAFVQGPNVPTSGNIGSFRADQVVKVTERAVNEFAVTSITSPSGGNPTVNLANRTATTTLSSGTNVLTYTNAPAPRTLKICKVAGSGVSVGTSFTFDITIENESNTPPSPVTVLAGNAADGGYCSIVDGSFNALQTVRVTERAVNGIQVSAITSSTGGNPTVNLANRTATMSLANTTVNVLTFTNFAPASCFYSINATSASIPTSGGSGSIAVTAVSSAPISNEAKIVSNSEPDATNLSGCGWTAVSNNPWITISSGSAGVGDGAVNYTVAPNTGLERIGTITVAGQTFTITQQRACNFSLNSASQNFGSASGSGSFNFAASDNTCGWTAVKSADWITLNNSTGSGNGTVNFTVAANAGAYRSGTITIGNQTFTVLQADSTPSPFLDTTFGAGGKVTTSIETTNRGNDLAIQSDGKIVIAGVSTGAVSDNFAVTRYNSDGTLDNSFGAGGKVVTAFGSANSFAKAVAVQPDGKIVVAGYSKSFNGNEDFALVRYNADGSLDGAFGTEGKVITAVGNQSDFAWGMALQSDGKIIAVGNSHNGTDNDFAVVRYNTNGALDASFGNGGKVITSIDRSEAAHDLAIQSDGKIVVVGETQGNVGFLIVRYNSDGGLDNNFGSGGIFITPIQSGFAVAEDVAIQPDGNIVVGGYRSGLGSIDFYLARYTANGALDDTFGNGGTVESPFGMSHDFAYGLALQTDGKIVMSGINFDGSAYDIALARYNTNGALDASFGNGGKILTPIGSGDDFGQALALQPDGRIVVGGYTQTGTRQEFAVVRYLDSLTPTIDRTVAFVSNRTGNFEIYTMNSNGSDQTAITNNQGDDLDPSWSLDGSKIVFTSVRNNNRDVYKMNADGSDITRLTTTSAVDATPSLSPDGTKIAFFSTRDGANPEIYVMNADGTNQTRLTNNSVADLYPKWSPDSSKIVFRSESDGNTEIYVTNVEGTIQTNITNHPAFDDMPSWSPDGSKIVFTRAGEIYLMNANGSNQVNISNNPSVDSYPAWSTDGTKIFFETRRDGNNEIYSMNPDGGDQVRITDNPAIDVLPALLPSSSAPTPCTYSINPTGRSGAFSTAHSNSLTVTATMGCLWTASSNVPWITVTGGTTGIGDGTVGYSVAANTGAARTGTITIAGKTFTVNQSAAVPTSSYVISGQVTNNGNALSGVVVTAVGASSASATTDSSGNYSLQNLVAGGNYTVMASLANYSFTPASHAISNLNTDQTANFIATIACSYSINPTSANVVSGSSNANVTVTASEGCAWTAVSNADWISVTAGASGNGNGDVNYSIAANTGTERTGTITIAGQTFTVTQEESIGNSPSLSIGDNSFPEPTSGALSVPFTVSLSAASSQTVTVDVATADDTAIAPDDYIAIPTTQLTFAPGETTKQVQITINADNVTETTHETFFINLSNASNATITRNQAVITIRQQYIDNGKIAFVSDRTGNFEIFTMNADGSNQIAVTNNAGVDIEPSWSPDGNKIVFGSARDGNHDIYTISADGSNLIRLTTSNGPDSTPSWSPDGTKIAFFSTRDNTSAFQPEIYVMNADGSNQTRLTNNAAADMYPKWSPDNSKIAFQSERDGNKEIYVMNADGSNQTNITNQPTFPDELPAWSPDGTKIVFVKGSQIAVMNANGSNQSTISNTPSINSFPVWSTDGTKIFFDTNRDSNREIYTMNPDGSGQSRVTENPAYDFYPAVLPPSALNPCTFSINPSNTPSLSPNVNVGTVSVTATAGCSWTATSNNAPWLTITNGSTGVGNGTVSYSVAANPGSSRNGTLSIAGKTFTIHQTSGCTYLLSSTSTAIPAEGGTGSFNVSSYTGCNWSVAKNADWITIASPTSGSGNGTVNFSLAPNTGAARTGMITVRGITFTIQQASGCTYALSSTGTTIPASGGTNNFNITAENGCAWTAASNVPWITITTSTEGAGNGTVSYSIAANTGTERTGTITIAGQTFTVTQAAAQNSATFTVTRTDDRNNVSCVPGDCSLREAIKAANDSSADDTINFADGLKSITLTTTNGGEMIINNAGTLTISGPGANVLTVDGGAGTNRIFSADSASVTISGMTLKGGNAAGASYDGSGGAIFADGGSLTLDGVHITGNTASIDGGGVRFVFGSYLITNSTFSGNSADNGCGGISNHGGGTLTVINSTISGNTARVAGGVCNNGNITLRHATITNNTADNGGGIDHTGSLNFSNTIIASNTASGGLYPDIRSGSGTATSLGNNLVGDSAGDSTNSQNAITYQPTDILDVNPMLGALYDNGGKTPTHALLVGSPAIDKGNSFGATTDQRGFVRPVDASSVVNAGDGSDIGAFELGPTVAAPTTSGQNVPVAPISNLNLNFGNVVTGGNTSVTVLTPNQIEPLPPNFALLGSPIMYNITTTAVFSGEVKITFDVPNVADAAECSRLRILHYVNNEWDISGNATPVYNNGVCTLSQIVTSFSPVIVGESIGATYSISGKITNNGNAISNVVVNLSGGSIASTVTDNLGNYSFPNLIEKENYTVTPFLANYAFNPPSSVIENLSSNQTANFAASQCAYSLDANGVNAPAAGNAASFTITASSGCAWTAATTNDWITITGAATGNGTKTISYSVAANNGARRTGTISIAGQSFIITQSGAFSNIAGAVTYGITTANQIAKVVSGVVVNAGGAHSAETNSSGMYLLENLTSGGNYTVTATKTTNKNGISAFDATLVLRCVAAGSNCSLTVNQQKAADADNSNGVSAFDATQILRYVAANGQNANTGAVGNWKFDPPIRSYSDLIDNQSNQNYTAFLIGEVDGDWTPSGSLAEAAEAEQQKHETITELIKVEDSSIVITVPKTSNSERQLESTNEVIETEDSATTEEQSLVEKAEIELSLPENISVVNGSIVTIPVLLTNQRGKEISSYSFAILFDPNVLQLESNGIETVDTLSKNGFVIVSDKNQKGRIGIAASALNNFVSNSGTLLYLSFKVICSTNDSTNTFTSSALSFETTKKGISSSFADVFGNRISSLLTNGSFSVVAGKAKK